MIAKSIVMAVFAVNVPWPSSIIFAVLIIAIRIISKTHNFSYF